MSASAEDGDMGQQYVAVSGMEVTGAVRPREEE